MRDKEREGKRERERDLICPPCSISQPEVQFDGLPTAILQLIPEEGLLHRKLVVPRDLKRERKQEKRGKRKDDIKDLPVSDGTDVSRLSDR